MHDAHTDWVASAIENAILDYYSQYAQKYGEPHSISGRLLLTKDLQALVLSDFFSLLSSQQHSGGSLKPRHGLTPSVIRKHYAFCFLSTEQLKFLGRTQKLHLQAYRAAFEKRTLPAAETLGSLVEGLSGKVIVPDESGQFVLKATVQKRDSGTYFTPGAVARWLAEATLCPLVENSRSRDDLLRIRVVDPAAGGGAFLLQAARVLGEELFRRKWSATREEAIKSIVENTLYGVDQDPVACFVARILLCFEAGGRASTLALLGKRLRCGDALLGPTADETATSRESLPANAFNWAMEFPEVFDSTQKGFGPGFDVVLTNPPWSNLRPQIKEFFAGLSGISDEQGVRLRQLIQQRATDVSAVISAHAWAEHSLKSKEYGGLIRRTGSYVCQRILAQGVSTRGDDDLYKYFMERALQLLNSRGRVGMIVPTAFTNTQGAAGLRRLYLDNGTLEAFLGFENKKRIFPIHGMFRFHLIVWQRGTQGGIKRSQSRLSSLPTNGRQGKSQVRLPLSMLRATSGDLLLIPELRSQDEADLLLKLHKSHPLLGARSNIWNVSFVRELDMTKDSVGFEQNVRPGSCEATEGRMVLCEGRMVQQYDSVAKAYVGGNARKAVWRPMSWPRKVVCPHYYVPRAYLKERVTEFQFPRAGFCDITGHANERSVLSALIPAEFACGNKVPTCRFDQSGIEFHLLWIAIANSFVVDWLMRRRISTTINFFHWFQIPFPRIDPKSEVGSRLVSLAASLTRCEAFSREVNCDLARLSHDKDLAPLGFRERAELRAEIDAIVAQLYELSVDEFTLLLDDFPLLDRGQPHGDGQFSRGKRRLSLTRDKALLSFCRSVRERSVESSFIKMMAELSDRVDSAERVGAVAYTPSGCALGEIASPRKFRVVSN